MNTVHTVACQLLIINIDSKLSSCTAFNDDIDSFCRVVNIELQVNWNDKSGGGD